jgi:hypothetical protein
VFSFCFFDTPVIDMDPSDMVNPMCPLQPRCVVNEASTHHFTMLMMSVRSISGIWIVPLVYLRDRLSSPRSSSSGELTLEVRNDMEFCISFLTLDDAHKSCATAWWNVHALSSSSSNLYVSSLTSNKCSPGGFTAVPVITSGKSFRTPLR